MYPHKFDQFKCGDDVSLSEGGLTATGANEAGESRTVLAMDPIPHRGTHSFGIKVLY